MNLRETRWQAREIKFVAALPMGKSVIEWARRHLDADEHGTGTHADQYSTSTVYFETPEFDVYRRSASYGRSKYRIRQYGASEAVFLERKFRTDRLLAKRRTQVPVGDLHRLRGDRPDHRWDGFWFDRRVRLRRLQPLIQLSYDRVARVTTSATGPVRMTIDTNLQALPLPDYAFLPGLGLPFLEETCIVEVKYRLSVPAIVKELAAAFGLQPQKVSKFRAGLRALDYPLPVLPDEYPENPTRGGADDSGSFSD
jgi:hypothetical protein